MQTTIAPVTVSVRDDGPETMDGRELRSFVARIAGGQAFVRASVSRVDVENARAEAWQRVSALTSM